MIERSHRVSRDDDDFGHDRVKESSRFYFHSQISDFQLPCACTSHSKMAASLISDEIFADT
jgi:hypothetical protein